MKRFKGLVVAAACLMGLLFFDGKAEAAETTVWTPRTVEQIKQDIDGKDEYTIAIGDTLSRIAEAWNKNINDLANLNKISNKDLIFAGNKLYAKDGMIQAKDNIGNVIAQTPDTSYTAPVTNNQASTTTAPAATQQTPAYVAPAEQPAATTPGNSGGATTPTTPGNNGGTTTPTNPGGNNGGTTTPSNPGGNNGGTTTPSNPGDNGGGTTDPTPTPTPTPEPETKFTYWYTASDPADAQYNVAKGTHIFDTEDAATAAVDAYADGLLAQGVTSSGYGVSSWQQ